jgi:tRNA A-37 threonylcarbamoyl transferase component Bud32
MANEGASMRNQLSDMGIRTPELLAIDNSLLVEEYIQGGNLYSSLASNGSLEHAFKAGIITGRMHRGHHAFVDNKAQNYLISDREVVRTDLGFTKRTCSEFARSMDVGSFLASVMDLNNYRQIEIAFYRGYLSETGVGFSYLAIIIRNLLALGFSSKSSIALKNMMLDSRPLLEI